MTGTVIGSGRRSGIKHRSMFFMVFSGVVSVAAWVLLGSWVECPADIACGISVGFLVFGVLWALSEDLIPLKQLRSYLYVLELHF